MSKAPPITPTDWEEVSPTVVKSPKSFSYPKKCPENCSRQCDKWYEAHTRTISFALYAAPPGQQHRERVCIYSFSCGIEVKEVLELLPNEEPPSFIQRVIPLLEAAFLSVAMAEKHQRLELGERVHN